MNLADEFGNEGWQAELRCVDGLRNCQFPANSEIMIGGTRERVTITMKNKGVHANMQTDASAFEAWALALLLHCRVKSIRIALDADAGTEGLHYERFLYRLKRFLDLFPGLVSAEEVPIDKSKALDVHKKRFLNQPNPREELSGDEITARMLAASAVPPAKIPESALEKALEVSGAFRKRFQLDKVIRQWPVGLFDERVEDGRQIFTGGKSAIDLLGIRDDTLFLFEIKKTRNRKAGAVSELLFYASVMRDALGDAAIFKFVSGPAKKNCAVAPADIAQCSNICAVLLAPEFHPLIEEPLIFKELNSATARLCVERPIRFESVKIGGFDTSGDFTFLPE